MTDHHRFNNGKQTYTGKCLVLGCGQHWVHQNHTEGKREMTNPISSLNIRIEDTGKVSVSAVDWASDGNLWAIESRPISISQLKALAVIIGADAVEGVDARLVIVRERLVKIVTNEEHRLKVLNDAKTKLSEFDADVADIPANEDRAPTW